MILRDYRNIEDAVEAVIKLCKNAPGLSIVIVGQSSHLQSTITLI